MSRGRGRSRIGRYGPGPGSRKWTYGEEVFPEKKEKKVRLIDLRMNPITLKVNRDLRRGKTETQTSKVVQGRKDVEQGVTDRVPLCVSSPLRDKFNSVYPDCHSSTPSTKPTSISRILRGVLFGHLLLRLRSRVGNRSCSCLLPFSVSLSSSLSLAPSLLLHIHIVPVQCWTECFSNVGTRCPCLRKT